MWAVNTTVAKLMNARNYILVQYNIIILWHKCDISCFILTVGRHVYNVCGKKSINNCDFDGSISMLKNILLLLY